MSEDQPAPATKPITPEALKRRMRAGDIVLGHTALATGSMFVPWPVVDVAAEFAVQVRMARQLCKLYDAPFPDSGSFEVITGLVGGVSYGALSVTALRFISFGSYFAGNLPSATTTAAYTWLLGELLIERLETTGRIDLPAPEEPRPAPP
jgi:uncharacterized protein (DUF697 family)